jgi:hypothetical protein
MRRFTMMVVGATVFFSVYAKDAEEAEKKTQKFLNKKLDGWDVTYSGKEVGADEKMRIYPDEKDGVAVKASISDSDP